jgi:hypothetical protein
VLEKDTKPEIIEALTLAPLIWALRDEQSQWRNRLLSAAGRVNRFFVCCGEGGEEVLGLQNPGKGNPDTNPTGKCAPGQNKDMSPGGLKKCPS